MINTEAAGVASELVVIADDWARVIVSNDAARIGEFMSEEWVIVSESGVATREQFLALVGSGELSHSAMDRVSDARVRSYGDTAVLTIRQTSTAHYGGQRLDADEWVTDVFARREGRWECVLTQITSAVSTDRQSA
ncbi:nuclear transport factor 2 family protein [Pseudonocardia parietis]|uniref:Ketosteroid isomerase-like protein n=1 Tax=Pseudonocardia parietis TaxID=570936 RepID=A0ABS4VWV6_9PSEU|nr:nuclear transport factor 2 family protein [Pseudonocardia parietis]MBP2368427.1 ketosteroid isomerase-like protein [Pseudonocardia parietis]